MTHQAKQELLYQKHICYKCLSASNHRARDCRKWVKCDICQSTDHLSAMHLDRAQPTPKEGEEKTIKPLMNASTSCTRVCGKCSGNKVSASKTMLVKIYPEHRPDSCTNVYATIDVASNVSLITPQLCEKLEVQG